MVKFHSLFVNLIIMAKLYLFGWKICSIGYFEFNCSRLHAKWWMW